MQIVFFLSLSLSLLSFLAFFFFLFQNKKEENLPFSFRQYFLYEGFGGRKNNLLRILQSSFLLLNVLSSILFYFLPIDQSLTSKYYFLLLAIFFLVADVLYFFLSFVDFRREKLRIALFMFFGAFITISNGMGGFILLSISRKALENKALPLIFAVLSFLFALLSFLPLLNPKLNNYSKMENVTEKDGSSHLERPKYFVMAYSEWILTFFLEATFLIEYLFFYFSL